MGESHAAQAAGAAGLFLALSWIFVLLRCYCRIVVVRRFGLEDYLCVLTQVILHMQKSQSGEANIFEALFTIYCAFVLVGVKYGTGRHVVDIVPQSNVPIALKVYISYVREPSLNIY
jgi:hypothetical protein